MSHGTPQPPPLRLLRCLHRAVVAAEGHEDADAAGAKAGDAKATEEGDHQDRHHHQIQIALTIQTAKTEMVFRSRTGISTRVSHKKAMANVSNLGTTCHWGVAVRHAGIAPDRCLMLAVVLTIRRSRRFLRP